MAGLKVVPVMTLADGSLDLGDLKIKAEKYKDNLAAFMVNKLPKLSQNRADYVL
jgi:glycine dehydrogenase